MNKAKQNSIHFLLEKIIDSNATKYGDVILKNTLLSSDIEKAKLMYENEMNSQSKHNVDFIKWMPVQKKPSEDMCNEQILLRILFPDKKYIVLSGIWKNNKFYCLDTREPLNNVTHWACLPEYNVG